MVGGFLGVGFLVDPDTGARSVRRFETNEAGETKLLPSVFGKTDDTHENINLVLPTAPGTAPRAKQAPGRTAADRRAIEAAAATLLKQVESDRNLKFFLEVTPHSTGGGRACKLPTCTNKITKGNYRIAVYSGWSGRPSAAAVYHVSCFEELVDFEQKQYMSRFLPLFRRSFHVRDLRMSTVANGAFLLDGGAEKLAMYWHVLMEARHCKRQGWPCPPLHDDIAELMVNAGSASFKLRELPGLTTFEFDIMSTALAPIESDGPGDKAEWNLFHHYLTQGFVNHPERGEDPPALSVVMKNWKTDCHIASKPLDTLNEAERAHRAGMSNKHLRAINRLVTKVAPDPGMFEKK
ncbi:hypothetical protein MN608_08700 [Microdochium nivale]|nr:hypothetical protein MN608_08700 [Microdochium nivale]